MSATTLQIKLEAGYLSINLYDVIAAATGDERAEIIDALACQDAVIDEVVNQIIDGWTSMGSHAGKGGAYHTRTSGIDGALRRISMASSEIARKEIDRLQEALKQEEKRRQEGWDAYHQLRERSFQ